MTHDLGDRPDPAVAPVGRWRLLGGDRRMSRAKTVAPVEDTVDLRPDLTVLALNQMLDNAENRLLGVQAKTEAILGRLADRRRWSGMTADQILAELKHEVFEVHLIVTGKAAAK